MKINTKVIFENKVDPLFNDNPMEDLVKRDLVRPVGNGLFVLQGELVKIMEIIEANVLKIAHFSKAADVYMPSILSWENTKKSEYLNSFSNQALVISGLGENGVKQKTNLGVVCPTVCYHYSSSLSSKTIKNNTIITAVSRCGRKEDGKLDSLERLLNFTMREVVFYGTSKFVAQKKDELLAASIEMFKKIFGLSFSVETASDPFFGKVANLKKMAQILSESKYELKADLPYKGTKLSIASFNNHGSVFYKRFGIKTKNESFSYSGCVGWGYERILFAILSQKGTKFSSSYYKKLLVSK